MVASRLSAGGRTLLVALLAGAAIVAVGGGAWWAWGRSLPTYPAYGAPPAGEAGRSPADPLTFGRIGGTAEVGEPDLDLAGVRERDFLTPEELAVYRDGEIVRAKARVARFPGGVATVLLARLRSPEQARASVVKLDRLELGYGFTERAPVPAGVRAGLFPGAPGVTPGGRAHYVRGDVLVRVEFRGAERAAAYRGFASVLAAQVRAVTPDG